MTLIIVKEYYTIKFNNINPMPIKESLKIWKKYDNKLIDKKLSSMTDLNYMDLALKEKDFKEFI